MRETYIVTPRNDQASQNNSLWSIKTITHTLSVDSSQVSVLKEGDEVSFGSFLESHDCGRLEA